MRAAMDRTLSSAHRGLMVFYTLKDALQAGFQVYDRTQNGYLVRQKTTAGWALAVVDLTPRRRD